MPLKNLSQKEKEIIVECVKAAVNGPFFDDDDFHILFGMYRNEAIPIMESLPDVDESDELILRLINNSINNMVGFPHNKDELWDDHISVPRSVLEKIFEKWKA